jgi:CRP-like cAMP-binding protein
LWPEAASSACRRRYAGVRTRPARLRTCSSSSTGSVRVQQVSDTGREVFLYRVHAGESCVLTTACMLADEDYSAEGIAETEVEAVAIPRAVF